MTRRTRSSVLALAAVAALAASTGASAHASVSPAVALDKKLQQFTLSVPTEKKGVTTTEIELTVPAGFAIDSFEPAPDGWTQQVRSTGSGERAEVESVTWTGGHVPTDEDAVFRFDASTSGARTYTFDVRQTYSDGSVVDWTGPGSSDSPAPTIAAVASLGGGGGSSTLAVIALAVAIFGLLLGIVALTSRGGRTLA